MASVIRVLWATNIITGLMVISNTVMHFLKIIIEGASTLEYIVTRWPESPAAATQQSTITVSVDADNDIKALELSGFKEPGALISVNVVGGLNIRYQVDGNGRVAELARYGLKS